MHGVNVAELRVCEDAAEGLDLGFDDLLDNINDLTLDTPDAPTVSLPTYFKIPVITILKYT